MKELEIKKGMHIYINIKNIDDIVLTKNENELPKILHQLDTFFVMIERYVSRNFSQDIEIEKITGGRIHLLYYGDKYLDTLIRICYFAKIMKESFPSFSKYQHFAGLSLQFGADIGIFYSFNFKINDDIQELTTIGFPANYAAKLQSIARKDELIISNNVYELLDNEEVELVEKIETTTIDKLRKKYNTKDIYKIALDKVSREIFNKRTFDNIENFIEEAREYSFNKVNFCDIHIHQSKSNFSFDNVSKSRISTIDAAVVYADVRDFTSKFNEDNSNINRMTELTRNILKTMYNESYEKNGVHIQFQGDRQLVLFPGNHEESIVFSMILKSRIREIDKSIKIGVGISYGRVYATKIGIRGNKDKFIVGHPVVEADEYEDKFANSDEIVISDYLYEKLTNELLIDSFSKKDNCYFTNKDINYLRGIAEEQIQENNPNLKVNKPYNEQQI